MRGGAAKREHPVSSLDGDLRLPELQKAVLAVCAYEVLVGVVGDANHVLLMDLETKRSRTRPTSMSDMKATFAGYDLRLLP